MKLLAYLAHPAINRTEAKRDSTLRAMDRASIRCYPAPHHEDLSLTSAESRKTPRRSNACTSAPSAAASRFPPTGCAKHVDHLLELRSRRGSARCGRSVRQLPVCIGDTSALCSGH